MPKSPTTQPAQLSFNSDEELAAYLREHTDSGASRMVKKGSVVNDQAATPEDPEDGAVDPRTGSWSARPCVNNQRLLHPDTVRPKGGATTAQFVLSDPDQLEAWNSLQRRLSPAGAPQIEVCGYEQQFAPALSSFVILVSFSELEYQQI